MASLNGVTWGSSWNISIYSSNSNKIQPNALQTSNGTVWLAWVSDARVGCAQICEDIYYETLNSGIPTLPHPVCLSPGKYYFMCNSTGTGRQSSPTLVQLANQTVGIVWSENVTRNYHLFYESYDSTMGAWSSPVQLTNVAADDSSPSAAVGRDGALWLVWNRSNQTGSHTQQLWFMTLKNNVWSQAVQLSVGGLGVPYNRLPSVLVAKDGQPRVVWAHGLGGGNSTINYGTIVGNSLASNKTVSTPPSGASDLRPTMVQDRNGTLWVFWQELANATNIYGRFSADGGTTWSASDVQLTFYCGVSGCGALGVAQQPTAIQSAFDKTLWVFYSSNIGSSGRFDIYAAKSSAVQPVHDVSMSLLPIITPSVPCPRLSGQTCFYHTIDQKGFNNSYIPYAQPQLIPVTVSLQNTGDFNENITVALTAVNTTFTSGLGSQRVSLNQGTSTTLNFNINTTKLKAARWSFSGNATIQGGVIPIGNRPDSMVSAQDPIHLLPPGDIDQDGNTTITDVSVVFFNYGFGCTSLTPISCSPQYTAAEWADFDTLPPPFQTINVVDASIVVFYYGSYS